MTISPDQATPPPTPVPPTPTDAGPTPVDADTGPCDSEGMTRTVPCGRCGLASQTCTDGRWAEPTECFDEGECFAGEVDRVPPTCGDRRRICDPMCIWRPYEGDLGGECIAGATRLDSGMCPRGGYVMQVCASDCTGWETIGGCVDGCSRAAHTSRSGADPVCIPAGPFVLGSADFLNASPVREVTLSEFYVDRYPVTLTRRVACAEDAACPPISFERDSFWNATPQQAREFCAWDGGALIDEFQWEKAGRGFAPSDRSHSWGDEDLGAEAHPIVMPTRTWEDPAAFPAAVSPFGVRQLGSWLELTGSFPILDYTDLPLTDPSYPAPDEIVVLRGFRWVNFTDMYTTTNSVSARTRFGDVVEAAAFRCVY